MGLTFVDLFAGIGGIRMGLELAGHKCLGFCEFDKFARTSYKAIFNTQGEWESDDIRTTQSADVPRADLWAWGFPCQNISAAGKQEGIRGGQRSRLFYEVIRLLAGLREENRPKWLLIENVKALLSIGNGFDFLRVLFELEQVGYYCEWQVLNSKDWGVPQSRERVFIIGHLRNRGRREIFPIAPTDGENPCKLEEITCGVGDAERIYNGAGLARTLKAEGGGGGAKTGLYAIRFRTTKRGTGVRKDATYIEPVGIADTLTAKHCGDPTADCCNGVMVCPVLTPGRAEKRQNGRRMKADGEPMFTLTTQDIHGVCIKQLPHGYNSGGEHDIAPTLTSSAYWDNNFVKFDKGREDDSVFIRKLTPKECWRLQGFPDWALEAAQAAGVSDTQLYRQAGNAVTVNVAYAIGKKLSQVERMDTEDAAH